MSAPPIQTILAVDPDTDFLGWVQRHLQSEHTRVVTTTSAEDAFALYLELEPALLLSEVYVAPLNGVELLKRVRQQDPNAMVVLTTGFPTTSFIIDSMKFGAFEFLRKERLPYELRAVAEAALRAREAIALARGEAAAEAKVPSPEVLRDSIIGESPAMQDVFKLIGRVSRSNAPVMITGESGTGKEVVARAIHRFSSRTSNEFVAINCAAIPANLLESELFGHEKGAFTGAVQRRVGRFEQCSEGTLFLDEIGDMPVEVQSKILRVLQEGQFSRVGGNTTLTTGARILTATNRNLEADVEAGRFREDLFYRLNVVRIHLPPLRQRIEDIPALSNFFLQRITGRSAQNRYRFAPEALTLLQNHNWPGNVRELENCIQRAVVLANTNLLLARDIPIQAARAAPAPPTPSAAPSAPEPLSLNQIASFLFQQMRDQSDFEPLAWLELELTRRAMSSAGNDEAKAAKLLGVTRPALRKRLQVLQNPTEIPRTS
ncbi:MAG TPA: sigma-54 dependent transcriptional regulator [Verrucomicrobiales bacterium]|nr:sigma-54 dependent transcriptional regulator [Verrucomicrobiales bacterium]